MVHALVATAVYAQENAAFLSELKAAVRAGDRQSVAGMVVYPAIASIGGLRLPIRTRDDLLQRYDEIFTREMREAIQRDDPNVLELRAAGREWKITTMRVPSNAGRPSDAEAAEERPRFSEEAARRLQLRVGPRPMQQSGSLAQGGIDTYVVAVPKGMLLDVRLLRVGRAAAVRVNNAKTGEPLNPHAASGSAAVIGRAPVAGDYKIEVRRTKSPDSAPLPYILSIGVK